jgi:hypothetical protein
VVGITTVGLGAGAVGGVLAVSLGSGVGDWLGLVLGEGDVLGDDDVLAELSGNGCPLATEGAVPTAAIASGVTSAAAVSQVAAGSI